MEKFESSYQDFLNNEGNENEDFEVSRDEIEKIGNALKDSKFRQMLTDYAEEVQDPKNRALYQSEMRTLELQKGNVIHFINPTPWYVLKTSVDGQRKAFINICSNELIAKPMFGTTNSERKGCMMSLPFAQSPPREDFDKAGSKCTVYDVIFNPMAFDMYKDYPAIKEKVEDSALDAIEGSFKVTLDRKNVKKPKLAYKGVMRATIVRYKIGDNPPSIINKEALARGEPGPQSFSNVPSSKPKHVETDARNSEAADSKKSKNDKSENIKCVENNYTAPKYKISYRNHIDLQNYWKDKQIINNSTKTIPEEVKLTVDLPLLSSSKGVDADVDPEGNNFELNCSGKANYQLNLKLPFKVDPSTASAKFNQGTRKLEVIMKTTSHLMQPKKVNKHEQISETCYADKENSVKEENSPKEENTACDKITDEEVSNKNRATKKIIKSHSLPQDGSCINPKDIPNWINGDVVVKSILKSSPRSRSFSESCVDNFALQHTDDEADHFISSLGSLIEDDKARHTEKTVRFNDSIQRQLYRSNSSILGQKKKTQKRSKSKRKARERSYSEGSTSSVDDDRLLGDSNQTKKVSPATSDSGISDQ